MVFRYVVGKQRSGEILPFTFVALRRTDKSRLVFLWTERGLTPDSENTW